MTNTLLLGENSKTELSPISFIGGSHHRPRSVGSYTQNSSLRCTCTDLSVIHVVRFDSKRAAWPAEKYLTLVSSGHWRCKNVINKCSAYGK